MREKFLIAVDQKASLQKTRQEIATLGGKKSAHMNFSVTVKVPKTYRKNKPPGLKNTICLNCSWTCHYNCIHPDELKKYCCAITDEHCTVCPNKCHWSAHNNLDHYFDQGEETEVKSDEAMR